MTPVQKRYFIQTIILTAILIILTILISYNKLDIKVSQYFYVNNSWRLADHQPWQWFYRNGTLPGLILAIGSFLVLLLSLKIKINPVYRKYAAFILLTMVLGPGLLVNGVFKDHWGRPRPRDCSQFNGKWEFREVWQPGIPGKGHSFPSGHVATAFHLIVIYYVLRRHRKTLSYVFLGGAFVYGGLMGVARIAQGGHFLSDAAWAAGITILSAQLLCYLICEIPGLKEEKQLKFNTPVRKKMYHRILYVVLLAFITWFFIFSKPVYHEYQFILPGIEPDYNYLNIDFSQAKGDINLIIDNYDQPVKLETVFRAQGFFERTVESKTNYHVKNDTLFIDGNFNAKGLFHTLSSRTVIELDRKLLVKVKASTKKGDIVVKTPEPLWMDNVKLDLQTPDGEIITIDCSR